jgi:hypothetical protein
MCRLPLCIALICPIKLSSRTWHPRPSSRWLWKEERGRRGRLVVRAADGNAQDAPVRR